MPTISTCPHCSRLVTIPKDLEVAALVRCPLCSAEYPLNEALQLIPPELIPVETAEKAILADIEQMKAAGAAPAETPIKIAPVAAKSKPVAGLVTEPFFAFESQAASESGVLPESMEQSPEIEAPPLVSSVILRHGTTLQGEQNPDMLFAVEEAADAEETAEGTENQLDEDVFSLIAQHKVEIEKEFPSKTEAMVFRHISKHRPRHVLQIFMGLVIGAVVGLSFAYVVLAWIAWMMSAQFVLPQPPKVLKPVVKYVLPDTVWGEKGK